MNKENVSKLWKIIQEADDYLLGEFYLASSHQQQAKGITFSFTSSLSVELPSLLKLFITLFIDN